MKRPINVQPEVKAYYLEIQMQGVRMRGGREEGEKNGEDGLGGGLALPVSCREKKKKETGQIGRSCNRPCYPTQTCGCGAARKYGNNS